MEKENEKFTENIENQVNEDIDLEVPEVNLPDYVLEVKDLYKSYGKKQVLIYKSKKAKFSALLEKTVLVNLQQLIALLV